MSYGPWMEMYHTEGGLVIKGYVEGVNIDENQAKEIFQQQLVSEGQDVRNFDGIFAHEIE